MTRPTPAMRQAMATAEVGDDVFGDDPTVNELEQEVARLTGKEAALFVTSGTMGNQLAIRCLTQPGDEVIVGEGAHPIWYEAGGGAVLSGVQFAVAGRGGLFDAEEMIAQIKPRSYWSPRTSLVAVENTHNRAGGRVVPQDMVVAVCQAAREHGLTTHLDGARVWNASEASGLSVEELARPFDTVTVCFSKGLGAPVGSALAGQRSLVETARRWRKTWGGGMRQSGVLAAAALHALRHHRARLADDHAHARLLAESLSGMRGLQPGPVETNIVNIDVAGDAEAMVLRAHGRGLLINASGPARLRAVTHLDVSRDDIVAAAEILVTCAS